MPVSAVNSITSIVRISPVWPVNAVQAARPTQSVDQAFDLRFRSARRVSQPESTAAAEDTATPVSLAFARPDREPFSGAGDTLPLEGMQSLLQLRTPYIHEDDTGFILPHQQKLEQAAVQLLR